MTAIGQSEIHCNGYSSVLLIYLEIDVHKFSFIGLRFTEKQHLNPFAYYAFLFAKFVESWSICSSEFQVTYATLLDL